MNPALGDLHAPQKGGTIPFNKTGSTSPSRGPQGPVARECTSQAEPTRPTALLTVPGAPRALPGGVEEPGDTDPPLPFARKRRPEARPRPSRGGPAPPLCRTTQPGPCLPH
ncbi:hypothetical protein HPG69_005012 [Diceros bicornis minor]|uniref:Uncharacterized protein n=1 Tax=Diceros bicornis minor TaxID=77932 RepID=A0A7J7ES85_DICBM|nr:hypothetical protein HPG69_005012 [Diceros bicornis minor]